MKTQEYEVKKPEHPGDYNWDVFTGTDTNYGDPDGIPSTPERTLPKSVEDYVKSNCDLD